MNTIQKLIEYALGLESVSLDKPFSKFPNYQVLRHGPDGKWFGLIMPVSHSDLGLTDRPDAKVSVIDVKADPELISILINNQGFFPAYHMNKSNWISILLDGTVPLSELEKLVKDSYVLTSK
ncbi:MmcQ/YjbR family DNA-binding protein [Lentilactobacillus sp. SPB1-3]|uniref:MmcQ/YjbR family DNA-binding protein n=1 Tax=Lentilactobacillus terminaliae TaxID=3003483 RepID=A0ACD5DDZ7_9LACO|nr:MmcQ/YjbR family DNA-binding protein [Lentilactobacillus sp. SPB1-3]MCZ0977688.1 MmcQ/YjbR family DNA-binding protein [Lentilactobacillus sp. SPB1-3]